MAPTRTSGPSGVLNTVVALLLILVSLARGFPLNGRELDSAVEGVQKYLESSGFPKMTRGEIMDFLNEFSHNARVSRSEKTGDGIKDIAAITPRPSPRGDAGTFSRPKIPDGESPLNYGYPMSSNKQPEPLPESTTPTVFVTLKRDDSAGDKKNGHASRGIGGRSASKKSVAPSVDLNAYAKFKKIPEARHVKIDDDMKTFLGDFGLLDATRPGSPVGSRAPRRRNDHDAVAAAVTESVDERLLKSLLAETDNGRANVSLLRPSAVESAASTTRDHVFNPSSSSVRTVDVNRIAKIVENIRLLTDDNNTVSLSQDAFQKRLENITAAIATIDDHQPAAAAADGNKAFNGYEVFFDDDDSKETDSDLPESPSGYAGNEPLNKAQNPPDPLSTDELQQLVEKNKNDVKRQQPANETVGSAVTSSDAADTVTASSSADSSSEATSAEATSSEATSTEATSDPGQPRDSSTAATADASPSLSQLAESFGGGDTASSSPATDEPDASTPAVPGRPRNGLYFYVDWNSFLTVNEGQKNQVNLRFAPKAGNPAHFFKINVP